MVVNNDNDIAMDTFAIRHAANVRCLGASAWHKGGKGRGTAGNAEMRRSVHPAAHLSADDHAGTRIPTPYNYLPFLCAPLFYNISVSLRVTFLRSAALTTLDRRERNVTAFFAYSTPAVWEAWEGAFLISFGRECPLASEISVSTLQ
jgi:hypothetical protein